MHSNASKTHRARPIFLAGALFLTMVIGLRAASPAEAGSPQAKATDAELLWAEVVKACQPPVIPQQWRTNRPSAEEITQFRTKQGEIAIQAADKAKEFYTKFPNDAKAAEAKAKEGRMLAMAAQLGNPAANPRLEAIEQEQLKDPKLSEEDRFRIRAQAVERAAMSRQADGMPAVLAEFEKGARTLIKEFPKRPEPYEMLLEIAANTEGEKALVIAKEIANSDAPEEIKSQAQGLMNKLGQVGKPLSLKFTAVDGREVNLAKLGGKVVLIDFWATWCGPCVAELPNVKAAYEKLHPKGFEIVGISFDTDKDKLEPFLAKEKMTWPQFFDGQGWTNKFGKQFGISSIPAMWLVDKKGILRDLNAREGLADKIEKMLAEPN
ncbi:MAG: TlpA family protein disulfide reductase [Candidatus Omnitrophica bacterium]|nr:TlpA family protein disulfide reductase [Candidatus Omnitrophota bacterium]